MSRFFLFLLLATAPLIAQSHAAPTHHPNPPADEDNPIARQGAFENHAREILRSELARKLGPACGMRMLSDVDFSHCFSADAAITERNYRAFTQTLKNSLAIPHPNFDPEVYPAAKTFAAGEVAWRSYMNKTCEAAGMTDYSGTGAGLHVIACQRSLTRQHMKDLGDIFLGPYDLYR